jgi:thiamine biosynthesis lipoprotein
MNTIIPGSGLQRVEHIMGMPIGIDLRDPDVDPAAVERAFDWLRWVDATFSTYKVESEISRLNRGELALLRTHPDVREVLRRCDELYKETDGYFDMRATSLPADARAWDTERFPDAVDPAGLVKGWSVDRAAQLLNEAGGRNYSINAGGDVRVRGGALPEPHWRVGIQHPYLQDRVAAVVVANDLAIATTGTYARGDHIVDPHTGLVPGGVLSVTIVGADLATADAYATAVYAMGTAGPMWTTRLFGYEAMTILADETVLKTMGFPSES